jgi:hypothetical protein
MRKDDFEFSNADLLDNFQGEEQYSPFLRKVATAVSNTASNAANAAAAAAKAAADKAAAAARATKEAAEKATKQAAEKAKQAADKAKEAADKAKEAAKNVGKKAVDAGKNVGKGLTKPFKGVARKGLLIAIRKNAHGLATRLAPAYLSDAELSKEKMDKNNAKNVRSGKADVEKMFESVGGKKSDLEKAVREGYKRKPAKRKSKFEGEAEYEGLTPEETADVQESRGLIRRMLDFLFGRKVKANPYEAGQEPDGFEAPNDKDLPESDPNDPIWNEEKGVWSDSQGNTINPETGEIINVSDGDKLFGMPKTAVYIGGGILAALAITGIVIAVVRSNK